MVCGRTGNPTKALLSYIGKAYQIALRVGLSSVLLLLMWVTALD